MISGSSRGGRKGIETVQDPTQSKGEEGLAEAGSAVCSWVVRRNGSPTQHSELEEQRRTITPSDEAQGWYLELDDVEGGQKSNCW